MPPSSPSGVVLAAAIDVAMAARTGGLQSDDVDGLRVKAEELLDRDDPLFRAVMRFATNYPLVAFAPAELAEHGTWLRDAALRATAPDPVDAARSDVYG